MARINITRVMLRSADIILSTTGAFVSGFIRTTTGSDISHAALYAGQNNVIESIKEGVKEHPISEAYSDARLVIVLRRRNMTGLQRKNVIAQARKFMNRPYDVLGAIGSGTTNKRGAIILTGLTISLLEVTGFAGIASLINNNASDASKDTKFFCSELVARSFELAGVPIIDSTPSYTNPRSIRTSPHLIYVGHLIGGSQLTTHHGNSHSCLPFQQPHPL